MSYANIVATGSASPAAEEAAVNQTLSVPKTEIESTPEPMDVDSKSAAEETDAQIQVQSPSPNQPPKAEKKQKDQNLAPAPVPSVSAWGSASSSRSNSNVTSVDTKHWPSPHEIKSQSQLNGNSSKKISAVKSLKEKWVPFKASLVLPQPVSKKPNSQKRNSNKNNNLLSNNNKQVHNDAKKRKNKTEKRPNGAAPASTESKPESKSQAQESESKSEQSKQAPKQQSQQKEAINTTLDNPNLHQHINSNNHHQSHSNNHNNHNNNNLRYQNTQYQQQSQQFIPFQPFPVSGVIPGQEQGPRQFRPFNSNRRFNKYQNNGYNGQHRQHNNSNNFQNGFNRRNVANLTKLTEPLFSLIKQIEYYFSIENLLKDIFLRKQMNSEGWLPLTVISSFYRISVLSAGDFNLVRRAVDELNGELLELGEFGESKTLKVRVKANYTNWILSVDQREANGQDESELVQVIEPVVKEASSESTVESNTEATTIEIPVEATTIVEEVAAN